jgi:thiol-disulfide isomerase/thioredoxin
LFAGCIERNSEKTGLEGTPLPSFDLLLTDSSTLFNTESIPKGKPTVLFYFAPRCPYSRAQMETIIEDMDMLRGLQFYIFTNVSFKEMKAFSEHYNLNKYPNVIVGQDRKHFFADYFKTPGVPYIAIYNRDKSLNKAFIGKIYSNLIKRVAEN